MLPLNHKLIGIAYSHYEDSYGHFVSKMEMPIPGKTVFVLKWDPDIYKTIKSIEWYLSEHGFLFALFHNSL